VGFAVNFIVAGLIGLWLLQILLTLGRTGVSKVKPSPAGTNVDAQLTVAVLLTAFLLAGTNTFGVVNLGERFLIVALMIMLLRMHCPAFVRNAWVPLCALVSLGTVLSLWMLSTKADEVYAVSRSGNTAELTTFVDDIYKNSRHKYFNHRIFIYANLGQYLTNPVATVSPPLFDHESSIVRIK